MEALGIAASIIAVVQISKQVIDMCTKYIEGVQDAPKDLRYILIEVSALSGLFEPLKILVGFDPETAVLEAQLSAPVEGCLKAIQELNTLLGPFEMLEVAAHGQGGDEDRKTRGKRRRLGNLKLQLAWPLKQDRAKRLLDLLVAYKSTINLLLSSHGISQLQKIRKDLGTLNTTLDSACQRQILNWLVTVNPSFNHNQALDLHQDGTCKWVLSSGEWREWRRGQGPRGIWIHGIPGAGKTILASFLATNMKEIASEGDKKGGKIKAEPFSDLDVDVECEQTLLLPTVAVYYYCHHARNHDEMCHFLAWLLSQLCSQAEEIPDNICTLFKRACRPQSDHLVEAIKTMATRFSKILVSIDAVDESQNRGPLAEFLERLATDFEFKRFHVVVTSRREADIERHLRGFICLSMSNWCVNRDIERYIEGQLQTDRALQRFSVKLRTGIRESLSSKANGMFRFATCQLQVLRKVPVESAAWKALKELPETLDETYERILVGIPLEWRQIVRGALCLLTCMPLVPVRALISFASANDCDGMTIDGEDEEDEEGEGEEPSEEAFQDIMGCLITISTEPFRGSIVKFARLAHYTISEYLRSPRLARSSASFFYLPTSLAISSSVKTMFKVVRARARIRCSDKSWQEFGKYFSQEWPDFLHTADTVISSDRELTAIVTAAADPRKPYYPNFSFQKFPSRGLDLDRPMSKKDLPDAVILANFISADLYATTTAFLLKCTDEQVARIALYETEAWGGITLLSRLICRRQDKYVPLFLGRCRAEVLSHAPSPLVLIMELLTGSLGAQWTLYALASGGFSVSPEGVRVTPLQLAISRVHARVVEVLLENGADPNGVGRPDGWSPRRLRHFEGGISPLSKIRGLKVYGKCVYYAAEGDADKIEELLVKAGGREFRAWRPGDFKEGALAVSSS